MHRNRDMLARNNRTQRPASTMDRLTDPTPYSNRKLPAPTGTTKPIAPRDHRDNRGSAHGTHQPRACRDETAGSKPSEVAMAAWF